MRAIRGFLSRWQNWPGLLIVLFFVVVACAAPWLAPLGDYTPSGSRDPIPHAPGESAFLGTLPGQIDVYHKLVWGTRDALIFGFAVALGAFVFGTLFGAISGYAGGAINSMMSRITDAFLSFPALAGVVFLIQFKWLILDPWIGVDPSAPSPSSPGELTDILAALPFFVKLLIKVDPVLVSLILFSWMPIARLVNTSVITLKNAEFIQAARVIGGRPFWIIRRHLIPNAISPALCLFARDVGNTVILQATLTFIGVGGGSTWGSILAMGRDWIIGPGGRIWDNWWVFLPATLAVTLFGIGWNAIGDGIADALGSRL